MILCTYLPPGSAQPRLGTVDRASATVLDLQAGALCRSGDKAPELASMLALIDAGEAGLQQAREVAALADTPRIPLAEVKLLAPLPRPRQIRCFSVFEQHLRDARTRSIALRAHINGQPAPAPAPAPAFRQPPYYYANRYAVVGPEAEIAWPYDDGYLDYEVEVGIVVGRGGRNIPAARARQHVFGYTVFNDLTARAQLLRDMELNMGPTKGKNFDTAHAMGPWIVTSDELPDVVGLTGQVRINGTQVATSTVSGMLYGIEDIVAHASKAETLYAGEFFASGTLGGGSGLEVDRWLAPGDTIEVELESIGTLRNHIGQPSTTTGDKPCNNGSLAATASSS